MLFNCFCYLLLCYYVITITRALSLTSINHKTKLTSNLILKSKLHKLSSSLKMIPIATESFSIENSFYEVFLSIAQFISTDLSSTNIFSVLILYFIGLLASFSPCTIGMLPVTLAYLGDTQEESDKRTNKLALKSIFYGLGLASTFSVYGLSAALFGKAFNSGMNQFLDLNIFFSFIVSCVYIIMGLNLLNIVDIRFPSIELNIKNNSNNENKNTSEYLQALTFGASSALLETPCTSPILAALLTYVSTMKTSSPVIGAIFLGYATPLISAGIVSGKVNNAILTKGSPWLINAFASALIIYGSYQCLESAASALI